LIYYLADSRFPPNAGYTDTEKATIKKLFEMYVTFANTGKATYGDKAMVPIVYGSKLRINEVISSKLAKIAVINDTFGNSNFWDKLTSES
jgi:hypothetical protein